MLNICDYKYKIEYKLQKYIPFIIAMPVLAQVQFCIYFNVTKRYNPNNERKYILQVIDKEANISNLTFINYDLEYVNLWIDNNVSLKREMPCVMYYDNYLLYLNHDILCQFYYIKTSYDEYSLQSYEVMNLNDFVLLKDTYNKFLSISTLYKFL